MYLFIFFKIFSLICFLKKMYIFVIFLFYLHIFLNKYYKYYLGLVGGFIILNTLYFEEINTFNTNAKVLVLFLILFFATNFFYNRSKKLMEVDVHEKAVRLINSALLLYYSGSFFVYLFYKFTQNNKLFYSDKVLIFNASLYLIFTIIILIAILQVAFHRKSPSRFKV